MAGDTKLFQEALKRGSAHAWNEQWTRAAEEYRRALVEFPEDIAARTYLAMALYKSGNYPEALKLYEALWNAQPANLTMLQRVAELQEVVGDREAAAMSYGRLADAHTRRRAPMDAFRAWKKVAEFSRGNPMIWNSLVQMAVQAGTVREIIPGYLGLARDLALQSRFQEAIQIAERAQTLDPESPLVAPMLAGIRRGIDYSMRAARLGEEVYPDDMARYIPTVEAIQARVYHQADLIDQVEPGVAGQPVQASFRAGADGGRVVEIRLTPNQQWLEQGLTASTVKDSLGGLGEVVKVTPEVTPGGGVSLVIVLSTSAGLPVVRQNVEEIWRDANPTVAVPKFLPEDMPSGGEPWELAEPEPEGEAEAEGETGGLGDGATGGPGDGETGGLGDGETEPEVERLAPPGAELELLPAEAEAEVAEDASVPQEADETGDRRDAGAPPVGSGEVEPEAVEAEEIAEAAGEENAEVVSEETVEAEAAELEAAEEAPAGSADGVAEAEVEEAAGEEAPTPVAEEVDAEEPVEAVEEEAPEPVEAAEEGAGSEAAAEAEAAEEEAEPEAVEEVTEPEAAEAEAETAPEPDVEATAEETESPAEVESALVQPEVAVVDDADRVDGRGEVEAGPRSPVEEMLDQARADLECHRLDEAEAHARQAFQASRGADWQLEGAAADLLMDILRERAAYGDVGATADGLTWLLAEAAPDRLPSPVAARMKAIPRDLLGETADHLREIAALPPASRTLAALAMVKAEEMVGERKLRMAADEMYRVLAGNSDFLPAQFMLAKVLVAQGRLPEAAARTRRLGGLYELRGNQERALEVLLWMSKSGLATEEDDRYLMSRLRSQGRWAEASEIDEDIAARARAEAERRSAEEAASAAAAAEALRAAEEARRLAAEEAARKAAEEAARRAAAEEAVNRTIEEIARKAAEEEAQAEQVDLPEPAALHGDGPHPGPLPEGEGEPGGATGLPAEPPGEDEQAKKPKQKRGGLGGIFRVFRGRKGDAEATEEAGAGAREVSSDVMARDALLRLAESTFSFGDARGAAGLVRSALHDERISADVATRVALLRVLQLTSASEDGLQESLVDILRNLGLPEDLANS